MAINATALAMGFSVTQLLTVLVSLFRLAFRLKIRKFWWEDMWAAVAMVGAMTFAVASLIQFHTKSAETARVALWTDSYSFTTILWSVRMSLLYSIVRVISPSTCLRNFTRAVGALFTIVWIVLIVLKTRVCVRNPKISPESPTCHPSKLISIIEVAADFAGDAIIVILSLRLLWRVKLPRRQRRMILSIFSCSAIMSTISLPHAIAQVTHEAPLQYILANLEVISSVVVCNLLVVVTYIYRVYMSSDSSSESESCSEDDDLSTPVPTSTRSLTTVELDTSRYPTTMAATDYFGQGSSLSEGRSVAP